MNIYRGFPQRLHHRIPHWVGAGALFHVRIALDRENQQRPLIVPRLARAILESARLYQKRRHWHITLFLLMPDHLHALLTFERDRSMSEVIRNWKRFHAVKNHVVWQEAYFDHRLREDERGEQLSAKMNYIRQNPLPVCARRRKTGSGSSIHSNGDFKSGSASSEDDVKINAPPASTIPTR
jgi:putative transposase